MCYLQAQFDAAYDDKDGEGEGGGASYYDDLKREVAEQAEVNRSEFAGVRDEVRVQYEGVQPGQYVRLEVKGQYYSLLHSNPSSVQGVYVIFICNSPC